VLVLARKCGETIRVGEGIRITVVGIAGGQVRLGIEAPETVSVHREEVWERIAAANVEASSTSIDALLRLSQDAATVEEANDDEEGLS